MDALKNFADKDMIEQITLLDEIKENCQTEVIPGLMELYATPLADHAVDEMVYHSIYHLLTGQDAAIIEGIRHGSKRVQSLCIRKAGESTGEQIRQALLDGLQDGEDSELLADFIRSLTAFQDPALVEILLPYMQHDDFAVVAWAMKVLVGLQDDKVRDALKDIIKANEEELLASDECDLRTAMAVDNMASCADEAIMDFLASYIHHPNPVFRRIVNSAMVVAGSIALPTLQNCLANGDKDEKIMAANIIGFMGDKKGADILVTELDQNKELEPNLKFAIYEALGRISSMKSIVGISDGLDERDELALIAVVSALDGLCNPGVTKVLGAFFEKRDSQTNRILDAMITAQTIRLFAALYPSEKYATIMLEALAASRNQESVEVFRAELEKMEGDRPKADVSRLKTGKISAGSKRFVAADDSKAMLFFYKNIAAEMGLDLVTAVDGKEALEYFQTASDIDILITDLNMPNMTGIELTKELRKIPAWSNLPILMATTESEQSQIDIARQSGVTDFISKPFTKETFKTKIEQFLGHLPAG